MTRALDLRELNRATLDRQGLLRRQRGPVAEVVGRLAGLQAQHANSPYIALWSRAAGFTIAELEAALEARSVVRATVMRATLHLVEARDFFAFSSPAAEAWVANLSSTARRAGVDLAELHETLLAYCSRPRTVAEMEAHFDDVLPDAKFAGAVAPSVRHVAFRMASAGGGLVHVPPSGSWKWHGKPHYVNARAWLPDGDRPGPEEGLRIAAERYLAAYGPASASDFSKWVGQQRVSKIRAALGALEDRLVRFTGPDGRELLDLAGGDVPGGDVAAAPRFLARWDSVLIGYDVRDRILPDAYRSAVIKKNGDILPTFLVDGFVAGLWSVAVAKGTAVRAGGTAVPAKGTAVRGRGTAVLRLEPFGKVGRADRVALEDEAERLVRFVEADADHHEVAWTEA